MRPPAHQPPAGAGTDPVQISLLLDADLVHAADALAAATGSDRTELIARGLRRELLYDGAREFVYVLLDETSDVRYVGRARDPQNRLRGHIAAARIGGSSEKEEWLATMLAAGHTPRMAIIDDAEPGEEIHALESLWIEHFRATGRLTNGVVGGVAPAQRKTAGQRTVPMRLSDELFAAIEAARGDVSRARWLHQVIREATAIALGEKTSASDELAALARTAIQRRTQAHSQKRRVS